MNCTICSTALTTTNCQRLRQRGRLVFPTFCDRCRLSRANLKYAKKKTTIDVKTEEQLQRQAEKNRLPEEIVSGIKVARSNKVPVVQIAELFGVSTAAVYKYGGRAK